MTQDSTFFKPATSPQSPRQNAQALVSAAASAYKTGDTALAEQLLIQATEAVPGHPDALQLLALLAKGKGDDGRAEMLMRESLKGDPNQAHVHNNLGNLLRGRGALDEAAKHYGEAARLRADYVEALVAQGDCLMELGRIAEAEPPLRKAFRLRDSYLPARLSLATVLWHRGEREEGKRLLREALAGDPDNAYLNNNLGRMLLDELRYEEAWPYLEKTVRLASNRSAVLLNAGNCLVGLGRFHDAVNHMLKAIELDPLNFDAHTNVNRILWEMGRPDDVGKSFVFAKQAVPHHPDVLEMAAEIAISRERLEEAEADLQTAAKIRPGTVAQFNLWTSLRLAQKRPDEAMEILDLGLGRFPGEIELLRKSCDAAFILGKPDKALDLARRMAALDPFSQFAAAYQATALRMLGDEPAARRLYDYDRFIHDVPLTPPPGYVDIEAFHADLIPALEAMHLTEREPSYQSLRNGTQTLENLFNRPDIAPVIRILGESVMAVVDRFAEQLPDDAAHPLLARRHGRKRWAGSWSVRLRESGHHVDHVHPEGWLSGSYYVAIPPCVADEADKPGWIKFGECQWPSGPHLPWEKAVRPVPGHVVLFPSYMWHGTIPTTGQGQRMTVAFDIAVEP